jgi:hypothetical protein
LGGIHAACTSVTYSLSVTPPAFQNCGLVTLVLA